MNTLQRYIFKEILVTSLLTVSLFVFILLVGNAIKDVVKLLSAGQISFSFFLEILLDLTPSLVAYALPLGLLTSVLLVLGKLSSQNELVAMKASGLSMNFIVAPIFFLVGLATIFSLFINFYYGPRSIRYYRGCLGNVIRENPLKFIKTGKFVEDFSNYLIYIDKKEGSLIKNCWIWELNKCGGGVNVIIKSDKGVIRYDSRKDAIVLTLLNGTAEQQNTKDKTYSTMLFKDLSINLPLKDIFGEKNSFSAPTRLDYMTLGELKNKFSSARRGEEKIKINLETQRRAVMSMAILSLAIIAIPLGIRVRRAETSFNIVIAVLLALAYYFVVMAISWLEGKVHFRPDLLIWIPNFIFQAGGIWMLVKANKH